MFIAALFSKILAASLNILAASASDVADINLASPYFLALGIKDKFNYKS